MQEAIWSSFGLAFQTIHPFPLLHKFSQPSSSLSAVSPRSTSVHEVADYETKRCAPAVERRNVLI